jgi:hypothetical protein
MLCGCLGKLAGLSRKFSLEFENTLIGPSRIVVEFLHLVVVDCETKRGRQQRKRGRTSPRNETLIIIHTILRAGRCVIQVPSIID